MKKDKNSEFQKRIEKILLKHREDFEKMTPEEQEALKKAQRRHARRVRTEIETSFEITKKKEEKKNK